MRIPRKKLVLPPLPYTFEGLEPVTSPEALKIHYEGHHKGYVDNFNKLLLDGGSREDLEFNYSGHILHSEFWKSYTPLTTQPGPSTIATIEKAYRHTQYPIENFINDMVGTAMKIKGSGWSVAVLDKGNLKVVSIPNHELRLVVNKDPVLILDAWEHVFYLDYANKKKQFFNGIVDLINWETVEERIANS